MADFLLLANLPPILLEKVIAKLDWKSYFHLQETCQKMEEFVRTHRKLYTPVDKNANFTWKLDENGSHKLLLQFSTGTVNITGIFGIRLRLLGAPRHMKMDFSAFCKILKRQRVACSHLCLEPCPGGLELTKELCIDLIKILTPDEIQMNSKNSNRFEALIHSRDLKKISLYDFMPSLIPSAMMNIVRYCNAEISSPNLVSASPDDLYTSLVSICQVLCGVAQFHWNLQYLKLRMYWNSAEGIDLRLAERLKNCSSDLKVEKVQEENSGLRYYLVMPAPSSCHIITEPIGLTFIYRHNALV